MYFSTFVESGMKYSNNAAAEFVLCAMYNKWNSSVLRCYLFPAEDAALKLNSYNN